MSNDTKIYRTIAGECALCLAVPCPPLTALADDTQFVCDQSGETKSKCEFEMLRCIYEAKFGYNITAAYVSFLFLVIDSKAGDSGNKSIGKSSAKNIFMARPGNVD